MYQLNLHQNNCSVHETPFYDSSRFPTIIDWQMQQFLSGIQIFNYFLSGFQIFKLQAQATTGRHCRTWLIGIQVNTIQPMVTKDQHGLTVIVMVCLYMRTYIYRNLRVSRSRITHLGLPLLSSPSDSIIQIVGQIHTNAKFNARTLTNWKWKIFDVIACVKSKYYVMSALLSAQNK